MNYGNEDTRYFGGIPSSIISYSSDRGRYQAYDGVYDISSFTSQQLTTLQDSLAVAQKQIYSLQSTRVSQLLSTNPNLLANGDCSQYTLTQPTIGSVNCGVNNVGFQLQGRAIPIMDRWYHVAELAGVNPQNLRLECYRVSMSSYINPLEALETRPSICTYGMKCVWKNALGTTTDLFAPEHEKSPMSRNTDKSGAILAVQHMVPDVTKTVNKVYSLGFWLHANYNSNGMVRILRQYNTDGGGGNKNTEYSLQHIHIKSFEFVSGWNYIETSFTTSTLNANTISGLNGLVIQIGPFYYSWKVNSGNVVSELYGSFPYGQASYEWVLGEIQLREDKTSTKSNFLINPTEHENTLPYICSTSNTGVEMLDHPGVMMNTPTLSFAHPVYDHTYTIYFDSIIRLPVKMKEAPSVIIFNCGALGINNSIGGYFIPNNATYNESNAMGPMWNGMTLRGLSYSYDARRLWVEGSNQSKSELAIGKTGWPVNAQIRFMTESSFRLNFDTTQTFTTNTASTYLVQNPLLYFNAGTVSKFVAIVAETHMGKQDQSEFLTYVDYSWTALTSRPFSVTI